MALDGRLEDKVAVITGAGRGIGREIALHMAREGASIVVNDLGANMDGTGASAVADDVVEEIRAFGGEAVANGDTVADLECGRRLVEQALDAFGGMDILVNNAGILRDRSIFNMEEADWDAVVAVHLKGHYNCARPFAQYIRDHYRTGCRILNFSSVAGLIGNFGQANYGAAKAGITGFSRVLALELAKYGCTVNTISPGALTRLTISVRTSRGGTVTSDDLAEGGPQHIAPLCTWLASEEAAGITAQLFQAGRGGIGIMQQPTLIKQFHKAGGLWTLAELDQYVPQLVAAKLAHDQNAQESAIPVEIG